MLRLGVIGYGNRIQHMVNEVEAFGTARLQAIADPRGEEIKGQLAQRGRSATLYTNADEMLANEDLDGVLIGTRCSLHARMAAKVAERKLPLYLEKPVGINYDDLRLLQSIWEKRAMPVVVSFPLRMTSVVQRVKEIIQSGLVGTIENVQAFNNVPYAEHYYARWYRDYDETGGLFLQKATHDLDYLAFLLDQRPRWISAMMSRRVYGGNMPKGLKCKDCSLQKSCIESPFNLYYTRHARPTPFDEERWCLFGEEIKNEDNGSALIEYENGVQLSYTQNFFSRNNSATRGAKLIGYKGTIDFDWYKREIVVHMHHSPRSERIEFNDVEGIGHFGGDRNLAYNFLEVMAGGESAAPLDAGILSALTCLKARDSAETRQFLEVVLPGNVAADR